MSTSADTLLQASYHQGQVTIQLRSGAVHSFAVALNPRLAAGTELQLRKIEVSPFGLHWPELDEDLSLRGILAGDVGQYQKKPAPRT